MQCWNCEADNFISSIIVLWILDGGNMSFCVSQGFFFRCMSHKKTKGRADGMSEKVSIPVNGIRTCTSGIHAHRASNYTTRVGPPPPPTRQSKQTLQTLTHQLYRETQAFRNSPTPVCVCVCLWSVDLVLWSFYNKKDTLSMGRKPLSLLWVFMLNTQQGFEKRALELYGWQYQRSKECIWSQCRRYKETNRDV